MAKESTKIKLLLVDDEDEFRLATKKAILHRGFEVKEADCGKKALESIRSECPDLVVLDLKMPGMGGIETLRKIREIDASLPVIILTGHGSYDDAMKGIRLEIVDFLHKPVDIDLLCERIRVMLAHGKRPLRERAISELMVPPERYPKLYVDQPMDSALGCLCEAFFKPDPDTGEKHGVRSARVYDRNENFVGLLRFSDLPKVLLPPYLDDSPYTTYFTGMFLAQCKVISKRETRDVMDKTISIDVSAPLMQAVHLMAQHHLITLPVKKDGELAGILRERDIVTEIINNLGSLTS